MQALTNRPLFNVQWGPERAQELRDILHTDLGHDTIQFARLQNKVLNPVKPKEKSSQTNGHDLAFESGKALGFEAALDFISVYMANPDNFINKKQPQEK